MPRNFAYGYIENNAARKTCLRKRTPSLLKKVKELSILCGITACGVVFSPNEAEPVFWPPSRHEVETILRLYEAIPLPKKYAKSMNQETYFKEKNKKLEERLKQLESSNRELENKHFLHQIYKGGKTFREFSRNELKNLECYVWEKRTVVGKRMQFLHQREENESLIGDEDPLMEQWVVNMIWGTTQYDVGSSNHGSMSQDNVFSGSSQLPHQDPLVFGVNPGVMLPHGNGEGINNQLEGDTAGNNTFGAILSSGNQNVENMTQQPMDYHNWPNIY